MVSNEQLQVEKPNPSTQETNRGQYSHSEIAVAIDKDILEFISTTDSLGELKESLRVHGFTLKYTSGDSIVYVVPERPRDISVSREKGIKIVTDFTKKFKSIELDVDKNHWDAVIPEISRLHNEFGKDKLLVKECASLKDKVTIICRESDSKELKKMFMDKIARTQTQETKEPYEEYTIDIKKNKLRLLKISGYKEKLISEYVELKVDIDEGNGKVTIAGPRQQCCEANSKIFEDLAKFCEKQFALPEALLEVLDIEEVIKRTIEVLSSLRAKETIHAVFHIIGSNMIITGINEKHAQKSYDIVKSLITEERIEVKQEAMDVIKTQKWIDFGKKVSQELKVCFRTNESSDAWVLGFKENVSSAQERIKKFLDDNSFGSETLRSLDRGIRRYILEHRKDELTKFENDYTVKISADEKDDKFIISGTKVERAQAQKDLMLLVDSVLLDTKIVEQPGLHKLATSGKVDRMIRKIELEHKCALEKVAENFSQANERNKLQERDNLNSNLSTSHSDATSPAGYSSVSSSAGTKSEKCRNVTVSWKMGNIVTEQVSLVLFLIKLFSSVC